MQNKARSITALKFAAWSLLFSLLAIIIDAVIVISLNNWDWSLFIFIFQYLWPLFLIFLAIVFFFIFILTRFIQSAFLGLFSMALLRIIASLKQNQIADAIRIYIDTNFDLNYFAAGVTVLAFAITVFSIYRERQKNKNDSHQYKSDSRQLRYRL